MHMHHVIWGFGQNLNKAKPSQSKHYNYISFKSIDLLIAELRELYQFTIIKKSMT